AVYTEQRRALGPPLRFGLAVGRHLAARGSQYDIVHTASFPYFPLLAAGTLRHRGRYRIFVDWYEVWTRSYWRRYAVTAVGAVVRMPGKVAEDELDRALRRAACLATASEREGYGLVVVEAAAHGTPSVVVRGPENAALELVHEGTNGSVAASAAPLDIAAAIL